MEYETTAFDCDTETKSGKTVGEMLLSECAMKFRDAENTLRAQGKALTPHNVSALIKIKDPITEQTRTITQKEYFEVKDYLDQDGLTADVLSEIANDIEFGGEFIKNI